jgi:L-ascorbate metabolism protein UlaG (beta-lactamase superfamily)
MKVTKYGHACVVLEEQGRRLVIDPGGFTPTFGGVENIVAVVVTHEHGDHLNPEHLRAIAEANPGVQIFAPGDAVSKMANLPAKAVTNGDSADAAPFSLTFKGQKHATIHPDYAVPENVGVMVNDKFYYPGDSFTLPNAPVEILAVPAGAPWMKMAEAMDFVRAVQPKICLPTHNALNSNIGNSLADSWLTKACESVQTAYRPLTPGENIEI